MSALNTLDLKRPEKPQVLEDIERYLLTAHMKTYRVSKEVFLIIEGYLHAEYYFGLKCGYLLPFRGNKQIVCRLPDREIAIVCSDWP
jgi:hypothetical protein